MKPKTARVVEPNPGRRKAFEKRVDRLMRQFQEAVFIEILESLSSQGLLAQDASLTNPADPSERRKLTALKLKILRTMRQNPEAVRDSISRFVAKNLARWMGEVSKQGRQICEWYVKNVAYDISASQAASLKAAGVAPELIKKRWSVPTVRRRFMSPEAEKQIATMVEESTSLITKVAADDLVRIQETVTQGFIDGADTKALESSLSVTEGFSKERVQRVVLDQTNKVNNGIQRANCSSLGIKEGIWIHVPGQYSSRESHIEMNGRKFDLAVGCYDRAYGDYVQCGELPYCRCGFRSVLPLDLLGKE